MDETRALGAFAALAQETRLTIVRLLVVAGRDGMAAGDIGAALGGVSSSRLSFHLGHLERAGLLNSRRDGRQVIYSAAYACLSDLIAFLMHDCCGGRPEICAPALTALACCAEAVPRP